MWKRRKRQTQLVPSSFPINCKFVRRQSTVSYGFAKKQIPPRMNTDDTDDKFKWSYFNFLIRVNQSYQCYLW